jgi:hypothetical protein
MAPIPDLRRHLPAHAWGWPRWGWPRGERDLLLQAALDPDQQRAAAALHRWFSRHSIEATDGREHGLLALVAERFALELGQRPEGPRMNGVRRQRWTRSQLLLGLVRPPLERMVQAGLSVVVLGATAEHCANPGSSARVQLSCLDLLLADDCLDAGLVVLAEAGWHPWSGESMLCLRRRALSLRVLQLQHGLLGTLRLRRWPLGDQPAARPLQSEMLRQATTGTLEGVPVVVPGASHRLALALAWQPFDPPLDGLLQAARLLDGPDPDGDLLLTLLARSQSLGQAQITLSYLGQRLQRRLPPHLLTRVMARPTSAWDRLLATVRARFDDSRWLMAVGRVLSPRLRRDAACGPYSRPGACLGWVHPLARHTGPAQPPVERQQLGCLSGRNGPTAFRLELRVHGPSYGQELVFELQTERRHLIQLRARQLWPGSPVVCVRFGGRILLPEADRELWIAARPSRHLRPNATAAARRRHGLCRFNVLRCVLHPPEQPAT